MACLKSCVSIFKKQTGCVFGIFGYPVHLHVVLQEKVANAPSQFIYESYDDIPMLAQLDRRSRAFTMQHLKEDDRTKDHPVIVAASLSLTFFVPVCVVQCLYYI